MKFNVALYADLPHQDVRSLTHRKGPFTLTAGHDPAAGSSDQGSSSHGVPGSNEGL